MVGFAEEDVRKFRRYIREPYGMVLVTGPTGSGKTTTLYAAINEIKTDEDKIITIEDPVEYQVRGITQIPVNEKKGLTFARGLRSILRHDPDKIMVGEIRDQRDGADRHSIGAHRPPGVHHGAREQRDRRDRAFHQHGRRTVQLRFCAELHPGAAAGARDLRPLQEARALFRGCVARVRAGPEGMGGRAIYMRARAAWSVRARVSRPDARFPNLLDLSDHIREMIIDRRPTSEIKRAAKDEGMKFLRESGLARVRAGITTLREINKVTFIE